jgi:glucose-1-phosphate thymidylyltransferase
MKGVILAGGLGTRLYPLTYATNKHLLPVYNKPMVFYPINSLVTAGINEVLVVTGGPFAGDFIRVLKNGKELGLKHLEFAYQETEGGIADALKLAEDFADGGSICVILGDNCADTDFKADVESFKDGALVFLKEVPDPERFGIATVDNEGKILKIEEKPKKPESNLAVTGLYVYDNSVFEKINRLKPSARGELEITDVNNAYLSEGKLRSTILKGYWWDTGTFDTLFETSKYWFEKSKKSK